MLCLPTTNQWSSWHTGHKTLRCLNSTITTREIIIAIKIAGRGCSTLWISARGLRGAGIRSSSSTEFKINNNFSLKERISKLIKQSFSQKTTCTVWKISQDLAIWITCFIKSKAKLRQVAANKLLRIKKDKQCHQWELLMNLTKENLTTIQLVNYCIWRIKFYRMIMLPQRRLMLT